MKEELINLMEEATGIKNTIDDVEIEIKEIDDITDPDNKFTQTCIFKSDYCDYEFYNKLYYIIFTENIEIKYSKENNSLIKQYNLINKNNLSYKHMPIINYVKLRKRHSFPKLVTIITICSYLQLNGIHNNIELLDKLIEYFI